MFIKLDFCCSYLLDATPLREIKVHDFNSLIPNSISSANSEFIRHQKCYEEIEQLKIRC